MNHTNNQEKKTNMLTTDHYYSLVCYAKWFDDSKTMVRNLLEFYDKVCEILQNRYWWVDCVYLGFQKALIVYQIIDNLDTMAGVRDRVLCWIRASLQEENVECESEDGHFQLR